MSSFDTKIIHPTQTTFLLSEITYRVSICMTYIQYNNMSETELSICSPKSSFLTYLPNQNEFNNSSYLVTSTGRIQEIFNAPLSLTTQHIQSVNKI